MTMIVRLSQILPFLSFIESVSLNKTQPAFYLRKDIWSTYIVLLPKPLVVLEIGTEKFSYKK